MNFCWIIEERTPSIKSSEWEFTLNAPPFGTREEARQAAQSLCRRMKDLETRIRKYVRAEK